MSSVSAGLVKLFWQFAEREGMSRAELLRATGLDADELDDGAMPVSREALNGLMHALYRHTGDPGVSMRLAEAADIGMLGFCGYVLNSCLSLRLQVHMVYQKLLNHSGRVNFRVEGDQAVIDFYLSEPPTGKMLQYLPLHFDFSVTAACLRYARSVTSERPELELRLPYAEQPHHARLRELVTGPLVFDAPQCEIRVPARELDRRLPGDAYLWSFPGANWISGSTSVSRALNGDLPSQVRQRLSVALSDDASLPRIARDLRVSARTLSRRLRAAGRSFQEAAQPERPSWCAVTRPAQPRAHSPRGTSRRLRCAAQQTSQRAPALRPWRSCLPAHLLLEGDRARRAGRDARERDAPVLHQVARLTGSSGC